MKREDIEQKVAEEVERLLVGRDMELVDVEYVRERDWYLRVFLDKEGGIDLDDCQEISEKLSAWLDANDPIRENYLLEVSSPGLDRVLKKDKDFIRYKGRVVDVKFFKPIEGTKATVGTLVEKTADGKLVLLENEKETVYAMSDISQIRLHLEF